MKLHAHIQPAVALRDASGGAWLDSGIAPGLVVGDAASPNERPLAVAGTVKH